MLMKNKRRNNNLWKKENKKTKEKLTKIKATVFILYRIGQIQMLNKSKCYNDYIYNSGSIIWESKQKLPSSSSAL